MGNEGIAEDKLEGMVAVVLFEVVCVTIIQPVFAVVFHSFNNSVCISLLTECLLCTRHNSRFWGSQLVFPRGRY